MQVGHALELTFGTADPLGMHEDAPEQAQCLAKSMRHRSNRDVNSIRGEVCLAVGVQRDVWVSNCFEYDIEFRRRWILDQCFVDRLFRIIIELGSGQHNQGLGWCYVHTSSTPKFFRNSSFLPDALAYTIHPSDLANCTAYIPTLVLPPLMKILWTASSLPIRYTAE